MSAVASVVPHRLQTDSTIKREHVTEYLKQKPRHVEGATKAEEN